MAAVTYSFDLGPVTTTASMIAETGSQTMTTAPEATDLSSGIGSSLISIVPSPIIYSSLRTLTTLTTPRSTLLTSPPAPSSSQTPTQVSTSTSAPTTSTPTPSTTSNKSSSFSAGARYKQHKSCNDPSFIHLFRTTGRTLRHSIDKLHNPHLFRSSGSGSHTQEIEPKPRPELEMAERTMLYNNQAVQQVSTPRHTWHWHKPFRHEKARTWAPLTNDPYSFPYTDAPITSPHNLHSHLPLEQRHLSSIQREMRHEYLRPQSYPLIQVHTNRENEQIPRPTLALPETLHLHRGLSLKNVCVPNMSPYPGDSDEELASASARPSISTRSMDVQLRMVEEGVWIGTAWRRGK
ncbi:MAG: hypothetical protein M1834_008549 [Cirrosporium novae-zelandiae]|nr:MAG: hypothetical protein M1834_008549 [Cirrosporium novae-zelandiae]